MIQIDNLEVVITIQESSTLGSNSTLIRRILQLLSQISHLNIYHIPKTENQEGDSPTNWLILKFKDCDCL